MQVDAMWEISNQDAEPSRPRRICIILGSRAEYGLLKWVIHDLQNDVRVDAMVVLTATLADDGFASFGEVRDDHLRVASVVELDWENGTSPPSEWLGQLLTELGREFLRLDPDLVLVVGDRMETLVAAQTAIVQSIPVAHIHGGELSEGSFDDSFRHALTKLASLHFPTSESYARRIQQLGERPESIFTVGTPGTSSILRGEVAPLSEVENRTGLDLSRPYLLVTYHPVTVDRAESIAGAKALVQALLELSEFQIILTGTNVDPGAGEVGKILSNLRLGRRTGIAFVESLGHRQYLSALAHAAACVGNSSSGLIEAPVVGTPTINIGTRQGGRDRARTVIDVPANATAIVNAIRASSGKRSPVDVTDALAEPHSLDPSRQIAQIVSSVPLTGLRRKTFVDCGPSCSSWSREDLVRE